jgi:hypothetical protein
MQLSVDGIGNAPAGRLWGPNSDENDKVDDGLLPNSED